MDNIIEAITEQLGSLGLRDVPLGKKTSIPPHLSDNIRTIQERALKMVLEASDLKGSIADSQELASHANQLLFFTKRFLEDYHGKPDQADS